MTRFPKNPPRPLPRGDAVGLPGYVLDAVVALAQLTKSRDARVARSAAKTLARLRATLAEHARRPPDPHPYVTEMLTP